MEKALIAYSGGVDSTLIAKIAYDVLGDRALAITAVSPSLLPEELIDAQTQAAQIGIKHELVETHEMDNPDYTSNPVNRCYFCKSELHDTLKPLALRRGYPYVVDGVNADDLQDYRQVFKPLKKEERDRLWLKQKLVKLKSEKFLVVWGLAWWDKPAQPCLSSRFPYGEAITVTKLQRVGRAEIYLRQLGYQNLRVRSQEDTAKIELPAEEISQFVQQVDLPKLVKTFQDLGLFMLPSIQRVIVVES